MEIFIPALLMGLAGSFHCAGMCGPIMLALSSGNSFYSGWKGRALYHFGRLSVYMLLGMLAGMAGEALDIGGFQRQTAIIAGVFMIVMVVIIYFLPVSGNTWISSYSSWVKGVFASLIRSKSKSTLFFMGATNGLLPCGMVYLAMVGSVASGSIKNSMIYMLVFGAGTLPMLLGISLLGSKGLKTARIGNKIAPYLVFALGILMIYRGWHIEPASCCSR